MSKPATPSAAQVLSTLRKLIWPDKAVFLPKFFQALPGGYGEGDQFLGVVVPEQHVHHMPRTRLGYAIEKLPLAERKFWRNMR